MQPLAGKLRIGASVRVGYLPQTQDWLDAEKTVLDHVLDASRLLIGPARTHLGRFLFSGDDVYKKVGTLSGGERSRLALAILTLRGANVLLLDEPTTHLDLDSQEVLQDVLLDFPGTILMVSHDRYLIDALATHIWMVEDRTISQHEGNYSDYVAAHEALKASAAQAEAKAAASAPTAERRARRDDGRKREERASLLEEEIARIEERMEAVSRGIDQAGLAQDLDRVVDLGREYEDLERALASRLHEWEAALTDGGRAEGA